MDAALPADRRLFRIAGALYLIIIVCGLWSEVAVRQPLLATVGPEALSAAILEAAPQVRLSLAADTLMALCDVALAVLLYAILAPVGALLAGLATAFRLVQAAIIGGNLLLQYAALHLLQTDPEASGTTARALLEVHGMGYDFGLAFFGLSCLFTGRLVARAPAFARWLGWLIMAAGVVYLAGTALRLLAPALAEAAAPAYLICVVAEAAFCLWLLAGGRRASANA